MLENSGFFDEKSRARTVEHSFHTRGKGVEKLTFFSRFARERKERKGVALGHRMPRHGMTKKGQFSLKLGRGERGSSQPVKQLQDPCRLQRKLQCTHKFNSIQCKTDVKHGTKENG